MQKGLSSVALLILLLLPLAGSAASFYDVAGTPYDEAYAYLVQEGVVQGVNGAGLPNNTINRAEALKVVMDIDPVSRARVQYYASHMPPLPLFRDIDQSSWIAPYIEAAFADGLITGYPDGTFHPEYPVRTEEAIALLLRANQKSSVMLATAQLPQDSGDHWYVGYINDAKQKNLFSPSDTLYMGYALTRGQFFNIAYRLASIQKRKLTEFPGPSGSMPADSGTTPIISNPTTMPVDAPATTTATPVVQASSSSESTYFAISLPSINILDLKIARPDDPFTSEGILAPLKYGVGNLFGYPGSGTKVMIYGHSSGYPWDISQYTKVFRGINKLNVGDRVYVNYHGTVYTYEVTLKETVDASDMSRFQGDGEELILYTCWPPDSIKQRYLVHATPVSE